MNSRFIFLSFFVCLLTVSSLLGAGSLFAETPAQSQDVLALPGVGFFKCFSLGGAYDRTTRSCFIEDFTARPLHLQASVFDALDGLFDTIKNTFSGKNTFTGIIDIFGKIGFGDTTHTLTISPLNKDIREGGVEDVPITGTDNVYLRFTFEGIGEDGAPKIKVQMIQKITGSAATLPHVIELEGLDTIIPEGQNIEMALTGTDLVLSLTFNGIQNGVPNISVELIQ